MKPFALLLSLLLALSETAAAANPLAPASGAQWRLPEGCKLETGSGDAPAISVHGGRRAASLDVPLDSRWKYLKLEFDLIRDRVEPGPESWQDARLAMQFLNAESRGTGAGLRVFHGSGSGRESCSRFYEIPEDARTLRLEAANFGRSGDVRFAGLCLTGYAPEEMRDRNDLPPPDGRQADAHSSLADAFRTATPTRERICLNGLWQFKPEDGSADSPVPPAGSGWGWFKIPGVWPDRCDSEGPNDAQELFLPEFERIRRQNQKLSAGWYRREIEFPAQWTGRRIRLDFGLLQGSAVIFLDGRRAGELFFPGGPVELGTLARPGKRQELAILVTVRTDAKEAAYFTAPDRLTAATGAPANRGITGDLYLEAIPAEAALSNLKLETSVRRRELVLEFEVDAPPGDYRLGAEITRNGRTDKTLLPCPVRVGVERPCRIRLAEPWSNPELWDTDTPDRLYRATASLYDSGGKLLDRLPPEQFGFREFEYSGRDFRLNGRKIQLNALVASHILGKADRSGRATVRALCRQMRKLHGNFLLPENYEFTLGKVSYPDHFYNETASAGILTAFTLPHAKDFNWNLDNPETMTRYRRLCEFLIRKVQNNPGVVLYAMNHNATGYFADQNPAKTGGGFDPEPGLRRNDAELYRRRRQAVLAASCARELDPSRPVYHHQSGLLDGIHTLNCYLNWAPPRERADWFRHWAETGVTPLFLVEYGLPHIASYSSYRGPGFIWGAWARQTNFLNEYNCEFLGEEAFRPEPLKEAQLAREERLLANGKPVTYAWIRPPAGLPDNQKVLAAMIRYVLPRLRALGVSGVLPWDQYLFWTHRTGTETRTVNPERFRNLKRPGIVPDFFNPVLTDGLYTSRPEAFRLSPAGEALAEAWAPRRISAEEPECNVRAGEALTRNFLLQNGTRRDERWQVNVRLGNARLLRSEVTVPAGSTRKLPVRFEVPAATELTLEASCPAAGFTASVRQPLTVFSRPRPRSAGPVELFDPDGATAAEFIRLDIPFRRIARPQEFSGARPAVIGRGALEYLDRLPPGNGDLLVMEQPASRLEALGFRAAERGFRRVFVRVPEHPALTGIPGRQLGEWRGAATLTAPELKLPEFEQFYPTCFWQGFLQRRAWRAGNRGSVASAAIEKPECGDFLPLLDCGFNLQFSPLLEHRTPEGRRVLFCQLDLSGRSEADPEADLLLVNLTDTLRAGTEPATLHPVRFDAAEPQVGRLLEELKIPASPFHRATEVVSGSILVTVRPDFTVAGTTRLLLGHREKGPVDFDRQSAMLEHAPELRGLSAAELYARRPDHHGFHTVGVGEREVRFSAAPEELSGDDFFRRTALRRNRQLVSRLLYNLGAAPGLSAFELLHGRIRPPVAVALDSGFRGLEDPNRRGRKQEWFRRTGKETASWHPVSVPGCFDRQLAHLRGYDGWFWYFLEFDLPTAPRPHEQYTLHLGPVDDESFTYLNDAFLGELSSRTNPQDYYFAERSFRIDGSLLKRHGNRLFVLVNDLRENGGILGTPYLSQVPAGPFYCRPPRPEDNPYRYYRW